MTTVTVRLFRDIGEQHLLPLLKVLRPAVAYALSLDAIDASGIDIVVTSAGPFDVSAYGLVITVDASDDPSDLLRNAKERARHIVQQVGYSLKESKYPQALEYRVYMKLGFSVSVPSVSTEWH